MESLFQDHRLFAQAKNLLVFFLERFLCWFFSTLYCQFNQFRWHHLRSFKWNRKKIAPIPCRQSGCISIFMLLQFDNPNSYLYIIKLHYTIYTLNWISSGVFIHLYVVDNHLLLKSIDLNTCWISNQTICADNVDFVNWPYCLYEERSPHKPVQFIRLIWNHFR